MLRFTRHGFWEILVGSLALMIVAVGLGIAWWPLAIVVVLVWLWLLAFFRDPERPIPVDQHVMVSPADGRVSDITSNLHSDLLGGPCVRIGIFLSVFNVHVNRSPCDGRVIAVDYKKGKFINAIRHNLASEENESNTIVLAEPDGDRPIAVVKQIVGLIARRIIFVGGVGETLKRGQRIGMIKFGSRTELYIPQWMKPEVKVQVGQSVRGGADVIAVLGEPVHTHVDAVDDSEFEPLVGRETPT